MKSQQVIVSVFIAIAVALLAYFWLTRDQTKRYSWSESYKVGSDQPYGTRFIRELLETFRERGTLTVNDSKSLKQVLKDIGPGDTTDYYFIGQSLYLDPDDRFQLLRLVEGGNDAFISSLDPPEDLLNDLELSICDYPIAYYISFDARTTMNFFHDSLRSDKGYSYTVRRHGLDKPYNWTYFPDEVFCAESDLTPLGMMTDSAINFVRIAHGKGNFYFHTNPLIFTNYFLTSEENLLYPAAVFSHLGTGNAIWDEFSKMPFSMNNTSSESPLYYLLQQPSLKYSWWMLLFTIALYVFFTAKRVQRIIPVLEEKTNTSLEFVGLISTLHYENGNHLDMARKKMRYFLYFIRSRYGIHTQTFNSQVAEKLAEKSGVPMRDIDTILKLHQSIDHSTTYSIDALMLGNLYHAIEHFYKQCK